MKHRYGSWIFLAVVAAHSATRGWVYVAIGAFLYFAGYVLACAYWPYANCRGCKGQARHMSPTGKAWRTCRRCGGTGRRVRFGRRVWNRVRGLDRDAT